MAASQPGVFLPPEPGVLVPPAGLRPFEPLDADRREKYCINNSVRLHPAQKKLQELTMEKHENWRMLGSPVVLQIGANLVQLINARRILDIGAFTGASALAWALATPDDAQIISMDICDDAFAKFGEPIMKEVGIRHKITLKIQPAITTLDELLAGNQAGAFDFAFIDANKDQYPDYYEKSMELLRSGGVIVIDNALFMDSVIDPDAYPFISEAKIMADLNKKIHSDTRVNCNLLPISDGAMIVFKR